MSLSAADVAAIRAAETELAETLNDPDPAAWVGHYTDDAIFVGHGRPVLVGRDALLAYAAQMPPITSLQIEPLDTDGDGDVATVLANVTGEVGGVALRVRSLLVWRRGTDGRWRAWREMLNTDA